MKRTCSNCGIEFLPKAKMYRRSDRGKYRLFYSERNTCSDRCRAEAIAKKHKGVHKVKLDIQSLIRLYTKEEYGVRDLSRKLNLDRNVISRRLKEKGIKIRTSLEQRKIDLKLGRFIPPTGEKSHFYKHGERCGEKYYRKIARDANLEECLFCRTKQNLIVHHKDLNHLNHDLKNLTILCNSCHMTFHELLKQTKRQKCLT